MTNQGYFNNVGRTRRDGIELGLGRHAEEWSWFASYTYLDATFRESLTLSSPNNPASVGGEIFVLPGDRLPLVPAHLLKTGLRMIVGPRLTLGGEVLAGRGFHLRGDEGNDGSRIGDYAVLNARAEYMVNGKVSFFVNFDNVLDEDYETFGLFGEAGEVLGDEFENPRFLSPAAPRAAWVGMRVLF